MSWRVQTKYCDETDMFRDFPQTDQGQNEAVMLWTKARQMFDAQEEDEQMRHIVLSTLSMVNDENDEEGPAILSTGEKNCPHRVSS